MNKLVIGVPTFNEAEAITELVMAIDAAIIELDIPIGDVLLANADSASTDDTVQSFLDCDTIVEKISLRNEVKGKGRNIWSLLNLAYQNRADLILIDGDIRSFQTEWLSLMLSSFNDGVDYVVPNYARKSIEGNTTNHFAYPLLFSLFGEKTPRQPIAGDFGLSCNFVTYLISRKAPAHTLGYGIDVYLTLEALYSGVRIGEIDLNRKIHNPSFSKIESMFMEVATSAFATIKSHAGYAYPPHNGGAGKTQSLLDAPVPIAPGDLRSSLQRYNSEALSINPAWYQVGIDDGGVDSTGWASVLAACLGELGDKPPEELAQMLMPFFMMRTLTYLQLIEDGNCDPEQSLLAQSLLLARRLGSVKT